MPSCRGTIIYTSGRWLEMQLNYVFKTLLTLVNIPSRPSLLHRDRGSVYMMALYKCIRGTMSPIPIGSMYGIFTDP